MSIKKNLILVPSNMNLKALGDVKPFIEYYKNDFNVYLLAREQEKTIAKKDGYTIVDGLSGFGQYLRYSSDYTIDAGVMRTPYRVSDSQYWISVWHGIPYKKMFIDFDYSSIVHCLNYSNAYDRMISMSPYYTDVFLRNALLYDGHIDEVGCAKVDNLFNVDEEKIQNIKNTLNIDQNKKVLLYAPTFREKGDYTLPFDVKRLKDSIEQKTNEKWIILVKLHYWSILKEHNESFIDVSSYPEISDLMLISDVLISDYSSLVLDYALLNKPLFLFQYDQQEYFKNRSVYFDFSQYIDPNNIIVEESKLYEIANLFDDVDNTKIIKNFYPYENGHSTQRIVEELNLDTSVRETDEINFLVNSLNDDSKSHDFIYDFAKTFKENYNSKINIFAVKDFNFEKTTITKIDTSHIDIALSFESNKKPTLMILNNNPGKIIALDDNSYNFFKKKCAKTTIIHTINECNDITNCIDNPVEEELAKWFHFINAKENKVQEIIATNNVSKKNVSFFAKVKRKIKQLVKANKGTHSLLKHDQFNLDDITKQNHKVFKESAITNLPTISIIIYDNILASLTHQLEMLSNLSNKNVEVIVVTNKDLDKNYDLNLKVIKKEFTSVGEARVAAIEMATSDYIYLLANNETILNYSLELMINAATKRNADIVNAKTILDNKDTNKKEFVSKVLYASGKIFNDKTNNEFLKDSYYFNKLYSRSLLLQNKDLILNSFNYDNTLNLVLLNKANTIINVPYTLNSYEQYSNNYNNLDMLNALPLESLKNRFNNLDHILNQLPDNVKPYIFSSIINNDMLIYIRNYNLYDESQRKDLFNILKDYINKYEYYYFKDLNKNSRNNRLFSYLNEDDFIGFDRISNITSINFHNEYLDAKLRV